MHPRYSEGPTCFTFGAHRVGQMMTGQRDNETLGSTCTTLSRCEAANLSAHQLRRCREHGGGVGGDAGGKGGGGRLHLLSLRPSEGHLPVRVQHVSAGCDSCEDERACQSRRLGADKGVSAWPKGLPRRQRGPQCAAPHGRHYITRFVVDPPCHKSSPLSLVNPSVGRRDCRPQQTSRHRTVTVTDR